MQLQLIRQSTEVQERLLKKISAYLGCLVVAIVGPIVLSLAFFAFALITGGTLLGVFR